MNYDVFLDESGLFLEASSDLAESDKYSATAGRKFASQIAGFVCREGVMTSGNANSILRASCTAAGIEYAPRFHANEHGAKLRFGTLVETMCNNLRTKNAKLIRLVNTEGVSFGDRVATYCNILAELLVRVCQWLESDGDPQVSLNVYTAKVVVRDDEETGLEFIERTVYLARIQELFGRVAAANGFNSTKFRWNVLDVHPRSAREDRRLQLADLISYSSHDDFRPLRNHEQALSTIRTALTGSDWTFSCDDAIARSRELLNRESYAAALIALAERANIVGVEPRSVDKYLLMSNEIALSLARLPPSTQKPHFQIISGWLNQVAEHRNDLDSSLRCIRWMQKVLCEKSLSDNWPIDWLMLLTDTQALTACNHDANTLQGREFSDRIDANVPRIASRWEYADDIMFSYIVKAVHANDCFDHRNAANQMASVVGYYESLDGFFADAFKGVFPEKVLSDQRARALGTQLQSEMALLLAGTGDVRRCRELSDKALSEFAHDGDRLRQCQYRCELETIAGDWSSARGWLARSLGLSDPSHLSLATCLAEMPDTSFGKAFSILHWSRIGAMSAVGGDNSELRDFMDALGRFKLQHTPWCTGVPCVGPMAVYPVHGILRHLSVSASASRDWNLTVEFLGNLKRVVEAKPRPVFQMLQIAANLQCAGLLTPHHAKARSFVLGDKNRLGAMQQIQDLKHQLGETQFAISGILDGWLSELNSQERTSLDSVKLMRMGRIVGY